MLRFVFIFLLFSCPATAQQNDDGLFFKFGSDTLPGKLIHLPELKRTELHELLLTRDKIADGYRYSINSDSVYKKIFSAHPQGTLPNIDFTRSVLLLYYYCRQCMVSCNHREADYGCHRNACMYTAYWRLADKKSP